MWQPWQMCDATTGLQASTRESSAVFILPQVYEKKVVSLTDFNISNADSSWSVGAGYVAVQAAAMTCNDGCCNKGVAQEVGTVLTLPCCFAGGMQQPRQTAACQAWSGRQTRSSTSCRSDCQR